MWDSIQVGYFFNQCVEEIKVHTKQFYPVIHCICPYTKGGVGHALRNARVAMENGADGVFLVGRNIEAQGLCYIYEHTRKQFPDLWIGMNFLDISAEKDPDLLINCANVCSGLDGLWMDHVPRERLLFRKQIKMFGGVAFRYLEPDFIGDALGLACKDARSKVDVITASDDKTGSPPSTTKLNEMRIYLGPDVSLAVASGVDMRNVHDFLPIVDEFLVASSVSIIDPNIKSSVVENLDPFLVKELGVIIHSFQR